MSFINSQSFDPLFSETKGKQTCGVSKYVYHPNTYTLKKNWTDMWDFANFVKRQLVGVTLIECELWENSDRTRYLAIDYVHEIDLVVEVKVW